MMRRCQSVGIEGNARPNAAVKSTKPGYSSESRSVSGSPFDPRYSSSTTISSVVSKSALYATTRIISSHGSEMVPARLRPFCSSTIAGSLSFAENHRLIRVRISSNNGLLALASMLEFFPFASSEDEPEIIDNRRDPVKQNQRAKNQGR